MIDEKSLSLFCPEAAKFIEGLRQACEREHISTPKRIAHFLAQVAHESIGFWRVVESLNYSAERLAVVWPHRFAVEPEAAKKRPNELALTLQRKPERIANCVYANRLGNGTEPSGDGWRYRGRGLIQVTGKRNYLDCSAYLYGDARLVQQPSLLEAPREAAQSAAWYWGARKLNALADRDDLRGITRAINGGEHGLDDHDRTDLDTRADWLDRAKRYFA